MNEKSKKVIDTLIERGDIPAAGIFEITEPLLDLMVNVWNEVYSPSRQIKDNKHFRNERKLARKLAGLNLMVENELRFANVATSVILKQTKLAQKCGFVYLISNPAFEGMYKVGMTRDLNSRLRSYQTYDPFRRFKVESYKFVMDRRSVEKQILERFSLDLVAGEWVQNETAKKVFLGLE